MRHILYQPYNLHFNSCGGGDVVIIDHQLTCQTARTSLITTNYERAATPYHVIICNTYIVRQNLPFLHQHMTIWPSGLRRQLQVLVRKSVGSNPTVVIAPLILPNRTFFLMLTKFYTLYTILCHAFSAVVAACCNNVPPRGNMGICCYQQVLFYDFFLEIGPVMGP